VGDCYVQAEVNASSMPPSLCDLFDMSPCGTIIAKNKGELPAYTLERIKAGLSNDAEGVRPNPEFVRAAP
jgi:hypothetical protein